jgi:hypothetical protein
VESSIQYEWHISKGSDEIDDIKKSPQYIRDKKYQTWTDHDRDIISHSSGFWYTRKISPPMRYDHPTYVLTWRDIH